MVSCETKNRADRKRLYDDAEKLMIDDSNMLDLFHVKNAMAYNAKLHNYKIPIQVLFFFNDVWMDK